jgi:hypothetical protein
MVSHAVTVRTSDKQTGRLPAFVQEGALLLRAMAARGLMPQLEQRLKVQRQGGYQGIDAFLYLLLTMTAPHDGGLGWLYHHAADWAEPLGALAGRDRLMSDTSLRRLLRTVHDEEIDQFSSWLLLQAAGVREWMSAPAGQTQDAQGQLWQLFAFDPVRIPIRCGQSREDPAYAPLNRRSRRLGQRGYRGRKRGERVFTASVVEALGCAVVLDVMVQPGNGGSRSLFGWALQTVARTMQWWDLPQPRPLLLCDGEFGNVPCLTLALQQGLPLLTRSARYLLLDDPAIWQHLQQGRWEAVEDAGHGPIRYACEVGTVVLPPSPTTRREDGQPFEPIAVRLVVSRYAASETDTGRGRLIDGQRYELYVSIAVPAAAFPAADVVAAFYSRCGQECHFQQHQQQLAVQDLFCFQPAGQRLAMLTAFFVWNARLACGAALHPPLPSPPAPCPRPDASDCPLPGLSDRSLPPHPPAVAPPPAPPAPSVDPKPSAVAALQQTLGAWDWPALLQRRPEVSFDAQALCLRTPEGDLPLCGVERAAKGCALRFATRTPHRLQASVSITPEQAETLHARLRAARKAHRRQRAEARVVGPAVAPRPVRPHSAVQLQAADPPAPPPYAVRWSTLQSAPARQAFEREAQRSIFFVRLGSAAPPAAVHGLVQPSRARRQHRRQTWAQHIARHQLLRPCTIDIEVPCEALARWLAWTHSPPPSPMASPAMETA